MVRRRQEEAAVAAEGDCSIEAAASRHWEAAAVVEKVFAVALDA